jgi:hypothetical protein
MSRATRASAERVEKPSVSTTAALHFNVQSQTNCRIVRLLLTRARGISRPSPPPGQRRSCLCGMGRRQQQAVPNL